MTVNHKKMFSPDLVFMPTFNLSLYKIHARNGNQLKIFCTSIDDSIWINQVTHHLEYAITKRMTKT